MGRTEFFIGKVIEPLPISPTIFTDVHTSDRGHDLSIWLCGVNLYAVGAKVGACLICTSMQEKTWSGHSRDHICTYRVVHSPTGGQMKPSHCSHSMDRRIGADSVNARPCLCT